MVEFDTGAKFTLHGSNLRADNTVVLLGTSELLPDLPIRPDRLVVTLGADIHAGVNAVRVIQRLKLGEPSLNPPVGEPSLHPGFESNVAALVIQPRLDSAVFSVAGNEPKRRITVSMRPKVGIRQQVMLLLNQYADPSPASPLTFSLQAEPRTEETETLIFDATKVPAATYLVRVRVDGTDSNLVLNTDQNHAQTYNKYIKPTVLVS